MTTACLVTKADRRRLGSLLATSEGRAWGSLQTVAELDALLEDAVPIGSRDAPETLVTMNSIVRVVDFESGEERIVTLVYPADSGEWNDEVSVTDPLGVALLGCEVGDMVQSLDDATAQHLRVAEMLYQPERALTEKRRKRLVEVCA